MAKRSKRELVLIELSSDEEEKSNTPAPTLTLADTAKKLNTERLQPEMWLNDNLINFFSRVLAASPKKTQDFEFLIMETPIFTVLKSAPDRAERTIKV